MIQFIKILRNLHISNFVYYLVAPFLHKKVDINQHKIEESISFLNKLSPNNGKSALCNNIIDRNPQYDLLIVVPVYKVEKYVEQCIDSILLQKTTYSYIVRIINDGSPDNSRKILNKYEKIKNIEIIDQENRGFSGARNTGLEYINAKYVMFVDSDDYLLSDNCIHQLLKCAYQKDADIVEGGFRLFYKNIILQTFTHKESFGSQATLYGFPWGKVYKSYLWEKVHFPENYWFEDTINAFLIYPRTHKKANIREIVYAYRKNMDGISVSSHKSLRNIDSLWITWQMLKDNMQLQILDENTALNKFLSQIAINQIRLETIGRKDILESVFAVNKAIFNEIFINYKILKTDSKKNHFLLQSIINNDFAAFRIAALLL